jgi:hypothetical protein
MIGAKGIVYGRASASDDVMRNLLDIQQTLSPGYNIDWERILRIWQKLNIWTYTYLVSRHSAF